MTIRFNLAAHSVVQGQMIELYDGDELIGSIYPTEHGIRVVSKYLVNYADRLSIDPREPPVLNMILAPLTESALREMVLNAQVRSRDDRN